MWNRIRHTFSFIYAKGVPASEEMDLRYSTNFAIKSLSGGLRRLASSFLFEKYKRSAIVTGTRLFAPYLLSVASSGVILVDRVFFLNPGTAKSNFAPIFVERTSLPSYRRAVHTFVRPFVNSYQFRIFKRGSIRIFVRPQTIRFSD